MATVLSISACPEIKEGRGRVVTGTVSHFNGFVKQLWFDDAKDPIEPTDVHPFYSLDRNDWVSAKDLRINETVRTATGHSMLRRSAWRTGIHRVYNIEVEREHVYYVSTQRVLVHNTYGAADDAGREIVKLTGGGKKKIRNLEDYKDMTVAEAIRARGGKGKTVNQVATDLKDLSVAEIANRAAAGEAAAETALKLIKQASKKTEK